MKQVIGFTSVFYTLWHVGAPYKEYTSQYSFYWKVDKQYLQNLSMDLEQAKAKMTGEYEIDTDLRGTSFHSVRVGALVDNTPDWICPFSGEDMRNGFFPSMKRVYYAHRFAEAIKFRRYAVWARRAMIESGELVRHRMTVETDNYDNTTRLQNMKYVVNYATEKQRHFDLQRKDTAENSGHFYNDGEKIELTVQQVASISFEGMYGRTYIITYKDSQGRIFKYMGGTPVNIEAQARIKATVKHSEYKGVHETKLQRIKILN